MERKNRIIWNIKYRCPDWNCNLRIPDIHFPDYRLLTICNMKSNILATGYDIFGTGYLAQTYSNACQCLNFKELEIDRISGLFLRPDKNSVSGQIIFFIKLRILSLRCRSEGLYVLIGCQIFDLYYLY